MSRANAQKSAPNGAWLLLLAIVLAAGAAGVAEVVVVVGSEADRVRDALVSQAGERVRFAMNADWGEGLSSSVVEMQAG